MKIKDARLRFTPRSTGVTVETATHRISAERENNGGTENCVYVPRRDVSSQFCAAVGRSALPTDLNCADFRVWKKDGVSRIRVDCGEEYAGVEIRENGGDDVEELSVFDSTESASEFFCEAGMRYSPAGERYDGIEFCPREFEMKPVKVKEVQSSYFERLGGAELDSAFKMEDIEHEWRPRRSVPTA